MFDWRLRAAESTRATSAFHSAFRIPHFAFQGFTILELLTAMAVLALILVMLVQVVNGVLQSTRTQSQQMDSVAAARRAVDVMAADLQNAVVGANAAILVPDAAGSNLFALLTSRRGAASAVNHRFLAIRYSTDANNRIIRSYGSVDYSQTHLVTAAIASTTTPVEPLAKGILKISIFANGDATNYPIDAAASANWATNNYNGFITPSGFKALVTPAATFAADLTNRTRALEIWIAAVDEQNGRLLSESGKLAVATGALGSDPATWRASVDASSIPSQAKSGIRILKKTVPLR